MNAAEAPVLRVEAKKNTVLQSHGRRPWYGEDGKPFSEAFVIGIAGGSASGKVIFSLYIVAVNAENLAMHNVDTRRPADCSDSFYKTHTPQELKLAFENNYDFDHPDAIDMTMFAACLNDLKACKQTNIPVYSFKEHQRLPETKYLYGAAIIIAEGILALHDPSMRALYDLKIFVQCDSDLMLARRIRRDVSERGRNVEGVLEQYLRFVKPAFDNFVGPSSKYADIIVSGANNSVAIDLITTHIRKKLQDRSRHIRPKIARGLSRHQTGVHTPGTTIDMLDISVIKKTPQLEGIYTILRDKNTTRGDFIFYADRLSTYLAEMAMELLPFKPKSVETPVGAISHGKELDAPFICGISVLRSGGSLERGLRRVLRDVAIGSLLIQTEPKSGEPLLLHAMLPNCVKFRHIAETSWVFLLDAQIGTAAAAMMAIRILLDHGVQEERIIFITFIVALDGGVSVLRKAFPKVRLVAGAVDTKLQIGWLDGKEDEGRGRDVWIIGK
ncbi:hypothetical protein Clacol_002527 [Clathrus columnatus]|uniref:uridine/cytidine kinase n=1 Tax=Clathrus columnatus TaxID=1419009 RepID=A0AAV5A6Y5_9AGAM|nr:hypothetical protein Clacol_002527 [Clathrus columnatus]